MIAVLGIFPDQRKADDVKRRLEQDGLTPGSVSLHARGEIGQVEQLLSAVTPIRRRTGAGLIIGAVIGGLAGLIGGMAVYPSFGSGLSPVAFGLLGMAPFAVLGGYLGSLYGSRVAENAKIRIKERIWNEDAVLVVARTGRMDEEKVRRSMLIADGEYVSSHELNGAELRSMLD